MPLVSEKWENACCLLQKTFTDADLTLEVCLSYGRLIWYSIYEWYITVSQLVTQRHVLDAKGLEFFDVLCAVKYAVYPGEGR